MGKVTYILCVTRVSPASVQYIVATSEVAVKDKTIDTVNRYNIPLQNWVMGLNIANTQIQHYYIITSFVCMTSIAVGLFKQCYSASTSFHIKPKSWTK